MAKKTNNPPAPKEPTLQEQAGLPSNFVPIESAPIIPGVPNGPVAVSGAPPSPPNMAPYFTGSIPPALQLSPDLINTQYAGPGTPSVRLMPVGAGGNPAIVAAVQSVIETSGLGQVNLTMPIQYKVSENGSNIVVTWKNVPATWALMGPPSTLQYGTPYFNVSNSYSGTSAGGVTIAFGQSLSGWASGTYAAGTLIVDSNGNVERCVIGGTTGGSAPTWPTSGIGTLTTDGGVTWAFVKYIISIGDAIVISNDVQQSGAITSITDASGNIYANICPPQTEPTSSTQAETWMALATANITYGSTLSVTLSWGSGQTYGTQFTTYSNVGLPTVAPAQALIASATTWSSGTVTTTVPSALLSISFCSNANNNTIASPFVIVSDDSPSGGGQICQVAFLNGSTPGAFTDHWTSSSGLTPAVVSLIALPATSTGSDQAGQPTFRAILTSDLPSSVVTSVVSDVNVTGSIFDQKLTLGWSGLLSKARGGTGTATPALVAGMNITITGSWPDQTINAAGGSPGGSTGQIQYNNSSAFAGAANLTYTSNQTTAIANSAATVPFIIQDAASQTADSLSVLNSSSTVLLSVNEDTPVPFQTILPNGMGLVFQDGTANNNMSIMKPAGDNLLLLGNTHLQNGLLIGSASIFGTNDNFFQLYAHNGSASGGGYNVLEGVGDSSLGFVISTANASTATGGSIRIAPSRTEVARFVPGGGMSVGSTPQTDEGNGTINVQSGIYLAGTAYTNPDYVFEKHFTGKIVKFADNPGASEYVSMSLEETEDYARQTYQLPRVGKTREMFARGDILLEKVEELYLHVFALNQRIKELEKRG